MDFIPVVVEGVRKGDFSSVSTLKLKAPANMTMLQFVDRIRARLKLPSVQACHMVLEKGFSVLMSQNMGRIYQDNKNEKGLLHLTCVTEHVFGCIPPRQKPVKSVFPGQEAMPFGAPEPNFGPFYDYEDPTLIFPPAIPPAMAMANNLSQINADVAAINSLQTAAVNSLQAAAINSLQTAAVNSFQAAAVNSLQTATISFSQVHQILPTSMAPLEWLAFLGEQDSSEAGSSSPSFMAQDLWPTDSDSEESSTTQPNDAMETGEHSEEISVHNNYQSLAHLIFLQEEIFSSDEEL